MSGDQQQPQQPPEEPMVIGETTPVDEPNSATSNSDTMDELPKMNDLLDAYMASRVAQMDANKRARTEGRRTTNYSVVSFALTKRDRLWNMKLAGELVDSALVCTNGEQELVHIDMINGLDKCMKPMLTSMDNHSGGAQSQLHYFGVHRDIPAGMLREIVHYAYHRQCVLTELNLIPLMEIGAQFHISPLIKFCLAHLFNAATVAPGNIIRAYELAHATPAYADEETKAFIRRYIEDHFDQMWEMNKTELMRLSYPMIADVLTWEKLAIKSESTVWEVIHAWTLHNGHERLKHLAILIKQCVRIGRLPESYTRESILGSALFRTLPEEMQRETTEFIQQVFCGELRRRAIKDGNGLLYDKANIYFRPREAKSTMMVAGGWIEGRTTCSIELYHYQLNLWFPTSIKLPTYVSYYGLEVIGSTLYAFGGSNGREIFKSLAALDLSRPEPKWISKCSMIERRCYVSSVVMNGQLYALGGFNQQRRIRKCERYNVELDSWIEIAELNYSRSDASAAVHDGRIYIAGGINDVNIEQSVEVYHVESNHWQLVHQMQSPRTSFSLTSYGKRIWAIGGSDGTRRLATAESYDPETNQWREEAPMKVARSTFRAAFFNGALHAVGGFNGENPVRSVEKYDAQGHEWVKLSPLLHERSGLCLCAIPNIYGPLKV